LKTTAYKYIADIANIFAKLKIKNVIISPGSRCAPLIIAFNRHPYFNCFSIVDERSAAFYALGMSQQNNLPTVLICTSGTALLNYSPAIAEAYYQKIPLIVLSADRPTHRINKNAGQTLNQQNVFQNFAKQSTLLLCDPHSKKDIEYNIHACVNLAIASMSKPFGPVHINIPFNEPLYNLKEFVLDDDYIPKEEMERKFEFANPNIDCSIEIEDLKNAWNNAKKKLIVVGQINHPKKELIDVLELLNKKIDVIIFAETTSNLPNKKYYNQYDRFAFCLKDEDLKLIQAEIIITIGEAIVSKRIKQILLDVKDENKYHIGFSNQKPSPFANETTQILQEDFEILQQLNLDYEEKINLKSALNLKRKQFNINQLNYISDIKFCDFKVLDFIFNNLPKNTDLQLGNSTPVRYSNLFTINKNDNIKVFSNRGVSGIDGQISTAAGAAIISKKQTICITGDLSFFYDSNAFWNKHLPKNLKVVLINNEGGGIFRFINGPSEIEELEEFFEAKHKTNAKKLVENFGVDYFESSTLLDLKNNWEKFLNYENCAVFEIFTDGKYSAEVLKNYFKQLQ